MPRTIHALLVGIDAYPAPINPLSGCVNDVDTFAAYLRQRVDGGKGFALDLRMLTNAEATRGLEPLEYGDVLGGIRSGHSKRRFWLSASGSGFLEMRARPPQAANCSRFPPSLGPSRSPPDRRVVLLRSPRPRECVRRREDSSRCRSSRRGSLVRGRL